jgi:hypothetical protein
MYQRMKLRSSNLMIGSVSLPNSRGLRVEKDVPEK